MTREQLYEILENYFGLDIRIDLPSEKGGTAHEQGALDLKFILGDLLSFMKNNPTDGELALEMVRVFSKHQLSPPDWSSKKIADCWSIYKTGRVADHHDDPTFDADFCYKNSLDEAFHIRIKPKKKDLKQDHYGPLIYRMIGMQTFWGEFLHNLSLEEIFKIVAKEFGMGHEKVKQLYGREIAKGHPPISKQYFQITGHGNDDNKTITFKDSRKKLKGKRSRDF